MKVVLKAVRSGDLQTVKQLLAEGVDVTKSSSPLPPTTPPLIEACVSGNTDILRLLVERSAGSDIRDVAYGGTPLHWAVSQVFCPQPVDLQNVHPNLCSFAMLDIVSAVTTAVARKSQNLDRRVKRDL